MILYEGPSRIDRSEQIVVIATGGDRKSDNAKTGQMVQIYILSKTHDPYTAIRTNHNSGACGRCPFQGTWNRKKRKIENRICYVNLGQAPDMIYKKYRRGEYAHATPQTLRRLLVSRTVRLGAYGDPAAMPLPQVRRIVSLAAGHTGYSHQLLWIDRRRADALAELMMCSVDNKAQLAEAERRGYRAFLTVPVDQTAPLNVLECRNATHGVSCEQCLLCDGNRRNVKSIYITAHAAVGNNHKWEE